MENRATASNLQASAPWSVEGLLNEDCGEKREKIHKRSEDVAVFFYPEK
jgi:hypothetical protein